MPPEAGTSPPPLILASASPRRAQLLSLLGLDFQVVPSRVREVPLQGESPEGQAERLSREKAQEVREGNPQAMVLAGDTLVVLGEEVLGKPRDPEDAVRMLMALAGRSHRVVSGLALAFPDGTVRSGTLTTEVTFQAFGEGLARRYVETGEPLDKAGAYGIQGLGSVLVREICGDYNTVVGFPLPLFLRFLEAGGWRYEFGRLAPPTGDQP